MTKAIQEKCAAETEKGKIAAERDEALRAQKKAQEKMERSLHTGEEEVRRTRRLCEDQVRAYLGGGMQGRARAACTCVCLGHLVRMYLWASTDMGMHVGVHVRQMTQRKKEEEKAQMAEARAAEAEARAAEAEKKGAAAAAATTRLQTELGEVKARLDAALRNHTQETKEVRSFGRVDGRVDEYETGKVRH